jgi:hypothetical protein
MFPNAAALETEIDTGEIVSAFNKLRRIIEPEDAMEYGYLKSAALKIIAGAFEEYIYIAEYQGDRLADEKGRITIGSILSRIKERALDVFSPYFALAQVLTLVALAAYIAVYIGVVVFLKNGGGSYNKSIVFGEGASGVERGMDDKPVLEYVY